MLTGELRRLLFEVITSWQVIVVTVIMLLYVALVNHVSRARYRRKTPPAPKPKKSKAAESDLEEPVDDSGLGLED